MITTVEMCEITSIKVVISNRELKIKFPIGKFNNGYVQRFEEIAKQLIPLTHNLRGNVYKEEILLTSNNRKIQKRFKI